MSRRKTNEEYIEECKQHGYDLPIESYVNAITKIKHKCKQCNNIYSQKPSNHLSGHGCPKCATDNLANIRRKSQEWYIEECKDKGYDLPIEEYVNAHTKIKHKCKNNHIYMQAPHEHLQGQGCPKCKGSKKKTLKQYYDECKEKDLDLPIESYVNNRTPIKHKCSKGHIYKQTPSDHLHKNAGCPICNESHGERYIRNYLDNHNIKYESQKRFHDLKDKEYLSYDFYLPDYDTLIEYQGQQHYESVSFNGKDYSNLEKQQKHDKLKREYAKDNGYKLLELHYSLDTQELVDKYLKRRIKG